MTILLFACSLAICLVACNNSETGNTDLQKQAQTFLDSFNVEYLKVSQHSLNFVHLIAGLYAMQRHGCSFYNSFPEVTDINWIFARRSRVRRDNPGFYKMLLLPRGRKIFSRHYA